MPRVLFLPSGKTLEVTAGTLLFDAACRVGLPVASSCSKEEVCGKCTMRVVEGSENLSPLSPHEQRLLQRDKKTPTDRVSCMTRVDGDCTVTTTYW